jgi:uncharacterized protein
MMKTVLGVFCKHPMPGKVKTRLAADIGEIPAARLYEAFLLDILERLQTATDRRILCYTPDGVRSRDWFSTLTGGAWGLRPQIEGSLGDRLQAFFDEESRDGPARVIVIGSDSPTISAAIIGRAEEQLHQSDAVIGPSPDGGYYLLGLRRMSDRLFTDIDWSTPAVYDQQKQRLSEAGFTTASLPPIPEVDDAGDLDLLRRDPRLAECRNTLRVLCELDLL